MWMEISESSEHFSTTESEDDSDFMKHKDMIRGTEIVEIPYLFQGVDIIEEGVGLESQKMAEVLEIGNNKDSLFTEEIKKE